MYRGTGTLCAALSLALLCSAQTTITVKMGVAGNFFDPPTISALQGDTVTFLFEDMTHGVAQSSFENPCLPLPGGFNSGLAGPGSNKSAPADSWNIQITNDTVPIWFFCQATRPLSHCGAGMVGAINPPSTDAFRTFLAAAKDVTATPSPVIETVLNGVGAFATSPPTPLPQDNSGLTTLFVTTTAEPSSTNTTSSDSISGDEGSPTNKAALIGGGIAGGIAVGVIAALAFLLIRTRMRKSQQKRPRARTPWTGDRPELKNTGNMSTGYSTGKGKYLGDTDEEGPDPFALREVSFISGDGAGLRQHNAQRWTGLHHDTPTAIPSPPSSASFPLPLMSPNVHAELERGGSARGHMSGARSIASASTSSRGGGSNNQLHGNHPLANSLSFPSGGDASPLAMETLTNEGLSHPLSSSHGGIGVAVGSVHSPSPFSDSAAAPLTSPPPVILAHQSSTSSAGIASPRQPDVNYHELAKEVASILRPHMMSAQQALAGSPPMSPPPQGQQQQSHPLPQPPQPHLPEKQQLQQHLHYLSTLSEEEQYATFPNPHPQPQLSPPRRQPRQLPRPLPLVVRNNSLNGHDTTAEYDDAASDRVTVAETEPPEYVRTII